MWVPLTSAIVLQTLVYGCVIYGAGRRDWGNVAAVSIVLALVPVIATTAMAAWRREGFPVTASALVAFVLLNLAITILSALRVPMSYTGLLVIAPIPVLAVTYATMRLQMLRRERVGVLDFSGARELADLIGPDAEIIEDPLAPECEVDVALVDGQTHHSPTWSLLQTRLQMQGTEVLLWMAYLERRFGRVDHASFDIAHLGYSPGQIFYAKIKRTVDVAIVIAAAPLALPLCMLVALYVRVVGGAPVLFRQRRRGFGGSEFTMLKFRTMASGSEGHSAREFDDRIIPGCRWIRRLRLDELPQLVNVLRGEMSWIGPRPVPVAIADQLEAQVPQYAYRHLVLPGLTGWAQVNQGYASTEEEEIRKLEFDLYYVKRLSFDIDLLILAKTVRIILLRIGAR